MSIRRAILTAFLAAVLHYAPVPAKAQEVDACFSPDTVEVLSESVVTAFRQPEKIIPAQALQGEKLQKLSVQSVADAIRYFSGVQIKDYGGIGGLKTVNVRGMGTEHVGVFYDGIQLGNAQNGQIDLGKYSLENMESVTLYNGQKSSAVQTARDYASASAVYLRARTPHFEVGKRDNLKLKLAGGSFGTVNPSALWEHRFNERVSHSLNAEALYTTGKYKFSYAKLDGYDTTAVRRNGDVRSLRIEEGVFGRIDSGEWRLKAYFYDSERGYPGAFVRKEPGKFRHEDRQWDTDGFLQGSVQKSWERFRLAASGKYACDWLHYLSDPRLDMSTMYVDNHYLQQEAYASVAGEFRATEWLDFNYASDWQFNTLVADLADFVYPSRHTFLNAVSTSVRLPQFKFQGSLLHTFVNDNAREAGAAADSRSIFAPTAVMQYNPFLDVNLAIRAFYKRIFRMPTLNDLYYTFVGNKYLEPEFTTQYNLGLVYSDNWLGALVEHLEANVDVYYNEVENKIIAMPASNQFQWTMVNLGLVQIRGVDAALGISSRFSAVSVDARATYTFQRAQDFTDPQSMYYGGQIPYIPWHSGSFVAGMDWEGWHLNYSFIYTGDRYMSQANTPENYAQPWYTSDMSLSKALSRGGRKYTATLEVNNIFNQQYEVVRCYPMPGINFRAILTIEL